MSIKETFKIMLEDSGLYDGLWPTRTRLIPKLR